MLIRCTKLSDHKMDQDVMLKWKSMVQLIADLGTKFHGNDLNSQRFDERVRASQSISARVCFTEERDQSRNVDFQED